MVHLIQEGNQTEIQIKTRGQTENSSKLSVIEASMRKKNKVKNQKE
jgi:hypothetical protein